MFARNSDLWDFTILLLIRKRKISARSVSSGRYRHNPSEHLIIIVSWFLREIIWSRGRGTSEDPELRSLPNSSAKKKCFYEQCLNDNGLRNVVSEFF
jgi:hypothetical protein